MLYLSSYLSQAPLVQEVAHECSNHLRLASPAFFENYRARNQALSRSFVVLQGLVDQVRSFIPLCLHPNSSPSQYNTAVIVSEASSPFSLPSGRRESLTSELNAMAAYTFRNAESARNDLHALLKNSKGLYGVGTRVMADLRKALSSMSQKRLRGWCWGIFCEDRDLDWTIEVLGEAVRVLEQPVNEAGLVSAFAGRVIVC